MNRQIEATIVKPEKEQELDTLRMTISLLIKSKRVLTGYKFGEEKVDELKEIEGIIKKLNRRSRKLEKEIGRR